MRTPKKTGDSRIDAALTDSLRDLPRFVDCGRIDVVTAGEPFAIPHELGRVPDFFIADKWDAMEVFASEDLRGQWTDNTIVLNASVAGTFNLYVGSI